MEEMKVLINSPMKDDDLFASSIRFINCRSEREN